MKNELLLANYLPSNTKKYHYCLVKVNGTGLSLVCGCNEEEVNNRIILCEDFVSRKLEVIEIITNLKENKTTIILN